MGVFLENQKGNTVKWGLKYVRGTEARRACEEKCFFSSRPKPLPSIPPGGSPSSRYKSAPLTLREKTDYK